MGAHMTNVGVHAARPSGKGAGAVDEHADLVFLQAANGGLEIERTAAHGRHALDAAECLRQVAGAGLADLGAGDPALGGQLGQPRGDDDLALDRRQLQLDGQLGRSVERRAVIGEALGFDLEGAILRVSVETEGAGTVGDGVFRSLERRAGQLDGGPGHRSILWICDAAGDLGGGRNGGGQQHGRHRQVFLDLHVYPRE